MIIINYYDKLLLLFLKVLPFQLMVPSSIHEPRAVISLLDYLMDRVLLSMSAVPRRTIFCSSVILILPGILPIQFSVLFLTSPKTPMITGTVVVFLPHVFSISMSRSLYFVSYSIMFKVVFLSVGIDISISRQVLSSLSFTTMSASVWFYLFVGLDWHVPKYSRCLVFCHSNWFMFVVFILYFDVIVFAYCPVEICCSFIVSLYVLCLGKLLLLLLLELGY